jgi:hypothetical protein
MINIERERSNTAKRNIRCVGVDKVTINLHIPDVSSKWKYAYEVRLALWAFYSTKTASIID